LLENERLAVQIAPQKWKHSWIHLCSSSRDNKRAQKKSNGIRIEKREILFTNNNNNTKRRRRRRSAAVVYRGGPRLCTILFFLVSHFYPTF
jgi:hypothetical protein